MERGLYCPVCTCCARVNLHVITLSIFFSSLLLPLHFVLFDDNKKQKSTSHCRRHLTFTFVRVRRGQSLLTYIFFRFYKTCDVGCPWMFQLWRLCVVFSCCSSLPFPHDFGHVYLAILLNPPSILSTSSSFFCVLGGADVDRCVRFCFPYRTDDQCDRRKKKPTHKKMIREYH